MKYKKLCNRENTRKRANNEGNKMKYTKKERNKKRKL
jgi:hypothetical protein